MRWDEGSIAEFAAGVVVHARDGIVVCDDELRYVWANQSACELLGYPLEDLEGREFLMNFPARVHPLMIDAYQAQLAGVHGAYPGTIVGPDGVEKDISWTNLSFQRGGRVYGAAIFHAVANTYYPRAVTSPEPALLGTHPSALIEQAQRLAEAALSETRALAVSIGLVDDDFIMRSGGRAGTPIGFAEAERAASAARGRVPFFDVWAAGRPAVIGNAHDRLAELPAFQPLVRCLDAAFEWRTAVFTPVAFGGHAVGGLSAFFPADLPCPSELDIRRLTDAADAASFAAEQLHLRKTAQRTAALEERARLARELHDSVTQAVFSLTLHSRAARRAAPRELPAGVLENLDIVDQLAAGALAEMRALIFELRPDALHDAGLVEAVRRMAEAVSSRSELSVDVWGPGAALALSSSATEQAYRIIAEALNNVAKHAAAQHAAIEIADLSDTVMITIRDDGAGFDPTRVEAGHLGLTSMRERAEALSASFDLHTGPGQGTEIRITIPTETGNNTHE
jgi:PAS domain S-box-containing protein